MGGYSYPDTYTFDVTPSATGMGFIGLFVVIYLLVLLFAVAFSIACYVLQSLGMYTVAQRRGIRNSWLAWIPFGNLWILGSISDQYQYVGKGKVKNRRKALLVLGIGLCVLYFILLIGTVISALAGEGLTMIVGILGCSLLLMFGVSVFLLVLQYMALYDLYRSCQPNNAVLYLILSIFFTLTMPFFVFACRKKDEGMPPRKQPAPRQVVEPVAEEPAEEETLEEGYAAEDEFEEE